MPQSLPLPLPEPAPPAPPTVPAKTICLPERRAWAAIHLSAWPLEALGISAATPDTVAVVDSHSPKAKIQTPSAGAQLAGITAGMAAAEGCARIANLQLKLRDTTQEARALDRLAAWSQRFTSNVSPEPPATLLLDIGGSLKLFGGRQALQARIRDELAAQGHTGHVAVAPTPRAAAWLARAGAETVVRRLGDIPGALGALPVSTLPLSKRHARRFDQLGIKTLRQAFRLPRAGLRRRFGPELLRDWDRALGQTPEPRQRWAAAERFAAERELPQACHYLDRIEPWIDELVTELTATLHRHNAGVDTLALWFRHEAQPPTRCVLQLLADSRDATRIRHLLYTRLERFVLPVPAVAVRLASSVFKPVVPEASALFGQAASPADDTLVDTLRARLGRQAVAGLTPVMDHRPEYAGREVEPVTAFAVRDGAADYDVAPRPFWLLATPQALDECRGQPQYRGQALHVKGPPERIESGWWASADMGRDYYPARSAEGAWLWVYREHHGARGWFVHGYFA